LRQPIVCAARRDTLPSFSRFHYRHDGQNDRPIINVFKFAQPLVLCSVGCWPKCFLICPAHLNRVNRQLSQCATWGWISQLSNCAILPRALRLLIQSLLHTCQSSHACLVFVPPVYEGICLAPICCSAGYWALFSMVAICLALFCKGQPLAPPDSSACLTMWA
jgi:hypothetical protein